MEQLYQFTMLEGERTVDDDGNSSYILYGLPEGEDFRDDTSYQSLQAGSLKVEDVAFAAPAFEFSEYQTYICVEQDTPGGLANITFEEM